MIQDLIDRLRAKAETHSDSKELLLEAADALRPMAALQASFGTTPVPFRPSMDANQ